MFGAKLHTTRFPIDFFGDPNGPLKERMDHTTDLKDDELPEFVL